jgi:hypothetical protein
MSPILFLIGGLLVGTIVGGAILFKIQKNQIIQKAKIKADEMLRDARIKSEDSKRESERRSRETVEQARKKFEKTIQEQAEETRGLIEGVYDLYDRLKGKFYGIKSPYIIPVIDFVFKQPIFSVPQVIRELNISRITAVRLVKMLEKESILVDVQSADGRTKFYAFSPLLKLLH